MNGSSYQVFIVFQSDSGASSLSNCGSPPAFVAPVALGTNCPNVLAVQSAQLGSAETIRHFHSIKVCN